MFWCYKFDGENMADVIVRSVNSILNISTLLALTQSFDSLFHPLCVNEYFLMSKLHYSYSLTNAALRPLVLLPSLSL